MNAGHCIRLVRRAAEADHHCLEMLLVDDAVSWETAGRQQERAAGFQRSKEICTWHRSSRKIGNILLALPLSHEVNHLGLAYSGLLEVRRTLVVRSCCVKTFLPFV